jgi:hypothetical protein
MAPFTVGQAQTHTNSTPNAPAPTGRYQIANGTPELSKNIMLLDTWTGETWIICGGNGVSATSWCPVLHATQAGN